MTQHTRPGLSPAESQYPLPSEGQVLEITPEMASDWLSTRRWIHNRRISDHTTSKYVTDMREGLWKLTRQGLIFDTEGYLIDGQHRLRAVANLQPEELTAKYGNPWIPFWVYPDEPTDTFDAYDQNFRRTVAHLINDPHPVAVAAGARFLASLRDMDPWSFPRFSRLSTAEILRTKDEWPELTRFAGEIIGSRNKARVLPSAHMAVVCQASRTELGTPENIASWFEVLGSGASANPNDPRLKLRDRFLRDRTLSLSVNRPLAYSMIVKAWNAHATGMDLSVLRWMQSEQIPAVEGFQQNKESN